jgi:signal transduction histidine kinase
MDTLEKIYKAGLELLDPLDLPTLYEAIAYEAVKLVGGDEGRILLREGGEFKLAYGFPEIARHVNVRKKGFAYESYTKNKAFIIDMSDYPNVHQDLSKRGIKSILFIPLSYKKETLGVLVVQSFEDKKFSEKELDILKLFGSLASQAIRRTQLFDEVKKALDTRDMFISMASHELRTPLTTISGYVQLLHLKIKSEDGISKIWMDELSKEVQRLSQLVTELLAINRIKAGTLQYNYKESNINEIIDRSIKTIEFGHPDKKIILDNRLGNDDVVIGDYDKLLQVLNNILENAAKYTPQGKEIKLTLCHRNNQLRIIIKDKGIGIPEEELPDIFKGYVQGKNHNREGLGLGLFLAKSIIDKHKGDIIVRSKEKKGTTVEIRLPKVNI